MSDLFYAHSGLPAPQAPAPEPQAQPENTAH
jgi:hypothetical protein